MHTPGPGSIPPQLAARLCHYLRPKIHPLLLDGTMNSPQTVRLNIFQARQAGGSPQLEGTYSV